MTDLANSADIGALARSYGRQVFRTAYRLVGDTGLAEDVQQDVFLRLLEMPGLETVESWPAYLAAMTTRLAIDRLRRQRRWWRVLPQWRSEAADHAPSAETHASRAEQAGLLRQALAKLKPREAECFALRHLQGLEIADIARAVGISENYVSVSLHRASRALEARLGEPNSTVQGDRS